MLEIGRTLANTIGFCALLIVVAYITVVYIKRGEKE